MTVFIERENGDLLSLEGVKTSDGEPEFLIVQSVKDYGPQNILSITREETKTIRDALDEWLREEEDEE